MLEFESGTNFWNVSYNAFLYGMVLPVMIIQLYRAIVHILAVRFYTSQGKEANIIICPN